jgi:hypothetical protein
MLQRWSAPEAALDVEPEHLHCGGPSYACVRPRVQDLPDLPAHTEAPPSQPADCRLAATQHRTGG